MSTLRVGNITATGGTGTITVPTGNQISQVDRPSGLVLVKTQTIGTAVSSVTVSDAFSADFDSYQIQITGGASSTGTDLGIQLGSTTSNYAYGITQIYLVDGSTGVLRSNSANRWVYVGGGTSSGLVMNAILLNPFLSKYTFIQSNWWGSDVYTGMCNGVLRDTSSYSAFTVATASGTMTGGTIRVYGYRNS